MAVKVRQHDRAGVPAPEGYRWATGGGSPIGECNGHHLARWPGGPIGTICGRVGPATPPNPPRGARICGNCARIAKIGKVAGDE